MGYKLKRRDSKNLTFDDMMTYYDFIANREEATRLRNNTTNIAIIKLLSDFIRKTSSEFAQWLDEEIE